MSQVTELNKFIAPVDLSSTSSAKWNALVDWFADQLEVDSNQIAIKYLSGMGRYQHVLGEPSKDVDVLFVLVANDHTLHQTTERLLQDTNGTRFRGVVLLARDEAELIWRVHTVVTKDPDLAESLKLIDPDVITEHKSQIPTSSAPGFDQESVNFLIELPDRTTDAAWHEANKKRFQRVLRDPLKKLHECVRDTFITRLSPEVAGGTRNLSILKKNDYGKGEYYSHYWFAFYDPASGSKTKSVQLFFSLTGLARKWSFGFSMGNNCVAYAERLLDAVSGSYDDVISYLRTAPSGTIIRIFGDEQTDYTPAELEATNALKLAGDNQVTRIDIVKDFPLESLPEYDPTIIESVGAFFTWLWPFFQASMSGAWSNVPSNVAYAGPSSISNEDTDEDAPQTLVELSESTALTEVFLRRMELALLAKQQLVLIGPPGTSKTYIAKQFGRYFVRGKPDRPQGRVHELYMHTNWTYEDFFEGLRPTTTTQGQLVFEPRKGFFLEWVELLKEVDSRARHVLILDELNRCDTASVLGELLQLLEYRGITIRLLSGRNFVFPRNLYILGTMNSADRSIGRMDFALRRRFFWVDLHSDVNVLKAWLARPGNNPIGFSADSLKQCNELLASYGIPKEQHVGHALFMTQDTTAVDASSIYKDMPLTEEHLRMIVEFSVLPYVRELLLMQFGKADDGFLDSIRSCLLQSVEKPT